MHTFIYIHGSQPFEDGFLVAFGGQQQQQQEQQKNCFNKMGAQSSRHRTHTKIPFLQVNED